MIGQEHPCRPNPPQTQMTLGASLWVSRSWPAATEPGLEPRISSGTASTVMQCLRPLHHSGSLFSKCFEIVPCCIYMLVQFWLQCCANHKPESTLRILRKLKLTLNAFIKMSSHERYRIWPNRIRNETVQNGEVPDPLPARSGSSETMFLCSTVTRLWRL